MAGTLGLYRLQQIDNQINQVNHQIKSNQNVMDDESLVNHAMENLHEKENHFEATDTLLKQADQELKNLQIKIQQNESSLYGKYNHTPKELMDLQNEIVSQRKLQTDLENRLIVLMQENEQAGMDRSQAESEKNVTRNDRENVISQITREMKTLLNNLEKLTAERKAAKEGIPPSDLDVYERLRAEKRGVAVASIEDKSCSACGSTLSASQIQSARSPSSSYLCPSCGRILYGG